MIVKLVKHKDTRIEDWRKELSILFEGKNTKH
jgi:hypothetical protein